MTRLPKVSVIIPCYNRGKFIAETVESALNQTYPNIELIVVDDGCTDNSREILERYADHIKIMEHPGRVNKGQSSGINLGLRNACGEYIAILDSDDLFASKKIATQIEFLENHLQFGLVYANGMLIDECGKRLYPLFDSAHAPPTCPEDVLLNCCFNLPSNALIRRSAFEKVGFFDESLRTAQDHDMAIRLVEVVLPGYIDQILWYYRRHQGSISSTRAMERWKNGFKILNASKRRYPYSLRTCLRRRAVLHFRVGQCYREMNAYFKAFFNFIAAAICDPLRTLSVLFGREKITSPH